MRERRGRVALIGYGRFGRALAELLAHAGHPVRAVDPFVAVPLEHAAASLDDALRGARWVVLATPVVELRPTLEAIRGRLTGAHTVIDVGSVKVGPCRALDECLGDAVPHAGTHPLFGPLSLARGERPLRAVVVPSARHPSAAARTAALFASLGCDVIEMDAEGHDRAMAQSHALAFFIAKGLIDIDVDADSALAPPSFRALGAMLAAVRGDAGHLFATIERDNPFAADARARLLAALTRVHDQFAA